VLKELPAGIERSDRRQQIFDAIQSLCARFDDAYWREKERKHAFPFEFHRAFAEGGWLGITMPEEFGGSGLGVSDAALMMQIVGNSAGAISACSSIHINLFGPHAIVKHGTPQQKLKFIPPLIKGDHRAAFGVTEPDAGLDTSNISTTARRVGDRYIISGQKMWTTTAQEANKILLLVRTSPKDQCANPMDGLTLFYCDLDRTRIEVKAIDKMGRNAVDSNMVFIDNLDVDLESRIGNEGEGFRLLLDSLNPERILIASEAIGVGKRALDLAAKYASEREVFGRKIGANQSIQHPLAESWMALEAADLMVWHAARRYDKGFSCGAEANASKYLAAEAAFEACDRAMRTHGGVGYAKEYNIERYFREVMLMRIAPVSREMILCHVAEKVLGLPRSY
jgi:acyl-CoA dehydrogenase